MPIPSVKKMLKKVKRGRLLNTFVVAAAKRMKWDFS